VSDLITAFFYSSSSSRELKPESYLGTKVGISSVIEICESSSLS
jgi:hypothetical protein